MANKPTDICNARGLASALPSQSKVEMSQVPVITPQPFKPEHSNIALLHKYMVVVFPRTSSFTKSSTTTKYEVISSQIVKGYYFNVSNNYANLVQDFF